MNILKRKGELRKMILDRLKKLNIPPLKSKAEMLEILLREEYGYIPQKPDKISFDVQKFYIHNFCGGKAVASKITAKCEINGGEFAFPFYSAIPVGDKKYPFFVNINFSDSVPDKYMPSEEIIDNGFAVLSFCYEDVTKDNEDFTDGLAGVLYPDGRREKTDAGKIAMWAWAAQRVLDYAQTIDKLDMSRSIVSGHSRLGKSALLSGATDERFAFVYSNNSGCSGAAITREKQGERIEDIYKRFPFWFCENYGEYIDKEHLMPFDQHYLIASIAPRYVCVGSASEDEWADPESEFLSCVAASLQNKKGFVYENRFPNVGEYFFDGTIGYHLRKGLHYFSREDWHRIIQFVKLHT